MYCGYSHSSVIGVEMTDIVLYAEYSEKENTRGYRVEYESIFYRSTLVTGKDAKSLHGSLDIPEGDSLYLMEGLSKYLIGRLSLIVYP
jgi:hypothetical protein